MGVERRKAVLFSAKISFATAVRFVGRYRISMPSEKGVSSKLHSCMHLPTRSTPKMHNAS
jgi:hypothetical protein